MTIRVLVVDDQQLVRAGLRMLCQTAADLEVVGEAATGGDAVRMDARLRPDVVLMDLRMPGMDGIRATERILAARPVARVVVLTTFCWPGSAGPRPVTIRSRPRCCAGWCDPP